MNCPEKPLVLIQFLDSSQTANWLSIKGRDVGKDDLTCWLVGWLVSETEDALSVYAAIAPQGDDYQGTLEMVVPRVAIVDWWEL